MERTDSSAWRITAGAWILVAIGSAGLAGAHPRAPAWNEAAAAAMVQAELPPGGIEVANLPEDALLVDVRKPAAFEAAHAAGALHLDPDDWDAGFEAVLMAWTPGQPIVVYCDGGGCRSSAEVAQRLRRELGDSGIHHLRGGWPALRDAGH